MNQIRLAFSGAGFLGVAHIGATIAFMEAGSNIVEVVGSSAGSVIAAMIAVGMTTEKMKEFALSDIPSGIISYQLFAIFRKSMNNGNVLQAYYDSLFGDLTFADSKIPIKILATDIYAGQSVVFSNLTTPHVKLADACRASSSVPFVWSPKKIDSIFCVDAGLTCNIGTNHLVDDEIPRFGIQIEDGTTRGDASTFLGFVKQCIGAMLSSNENNLIAWAKDTNASIISVDVSKYDFLDANLSKDSKQDLLNRGYSAVKSFIDNQKK